MTTRTTPYALGTPCWVDLFTSDPERSAAFYSVLLGWERRDLGAELGGYALLCSGGEPVAGTQLAAAHLLEDLATDLLVRGLG